MPFASIPELLDELRAGRMIILVDDPDRENEGDLVIAAEKITTEAMNFIIRHTSGIVCLCLPGEKADALHLPLQVATNTSRRGTQFTVSIEAAQGVTTGVSAADRTVTVQTAVRPDCQPQDLARPGHVYPIRAAEGGVLRRAGHTEGSTDLCRLAGLAPHAVLSEVMNEDGTMARVPDLEVFAARHGLKMGAIRDLIEWRRHSERLIERHETVRLPTPYGTFDLHAYTGKTDPEPHLALTMGIATPPADGRGNPPLDAPILVRAHSECLTGDVFHSQRCDCGPQLEAAMERIAKEGRGVVLYMRQEGRGIGLLAKIRAYALQEQGLDTVEANEALGFKPDHRDYGIGAQILFDLGVRRLRLLTNNPTKYRSMAGYGLEIVARVPIETTVYATNEAYLRTKADKMGHLLTLPRADGTPSAPSGSEG
jgi:3,4-dihydroxy 2-butanone 4-phosphate synthase/GTP cyclohydrolase II